MTPTTSLAATFFNLLGELMRENPKDYKFIVFFITARQTQFFAELGQAVYNQVARSAQKGGKHKKINLYEIHSRKSQSARNKASDDFRECTTGILLSSDVSARGLDYPNVTHVIQIGVPSSREQ